MPVMNRTQKKVVAAAAQLEEGVKAVIADGTSLIINKKSMTKDEIVARLKSLDGQVEAVTNTTAALAKVKVDLTAGVSETTQFISMLKPALTGVLGTDTVSLAQCGIVPRKAPRPLSPEAALLRTARLIATRGARHTMGPKQKKAIKGVVPPTPSGEPGKG